jgi:hypothetical protein
MSFDSTWPNATADSTNNESHPPPEPGEYSVTVQDARAFTSKAGNEVMIVEFCVLDGPRAGYVWSDVRGFKSEAAAGVAKSFCAALGVSHAEVTSLKELDYALKLVVGFYYKVAVVQNGQYTNVYVNERLDGSAVPASDVPNGDVPTHVPSTASDESVPF